VRANRKNHQASGNVECARSHRPPTLAGSCTALRLQHARLAATSVPLAGPSAETFCAIGTARRTVPPCIRRPVEQSSLSIKPESPTTRCPRTRSSTLALELRRTWRGRELDVHAQVAADALAVRHHTAEALLRLTWARLDPEPITGPRCLWAEMATGPRPIENVIGVSYARAYWGLATTL
jgi:hypothetical protein